MITPPPCLLPLHILRPAGLLLPLFLPQDVVNAPADLLGFFHFLFQRKIPPVERFLDKWKLGKIALKLKPEIEARAKANQGTRVDLSVNSPKSYTPTDTRKEMAQAVGIGEQVMGRIAQLAENAPPSLKDALESKKVSVNRGWKILKAVQSLPLEEQESATAEMLSAVREIDQLDTESDRRHKIAGLFCKVFERAVLLTPTEENVRIWTECTRMRPDEIEDSAKEADELAEVFSTIAGILRTLT